MDESGKDTEARSFNPRKAPKSRNGCLRCKAKRLKCDETKPECQNCRLRTLPCPGYKPKTFVWSTKHEKHLHQRQSRTSSQDDSSSSALQASSSTFESAPDAFQSTLPLENQFDESSAIRQNDRLPSPALSQQTEMTISGRRNSNQFTDSLSAIRHQLEHSTVPGFLLHLPTMLVEYYFNYVCQIFSSFDGTLNPFRSTVGRLWDGSAPIYYAIQSMAAAYLSNHFPRMSQVGIQMQQETYKCLYQVQPGDKSEDLDRTLLTVLLVGQTTAWHNPKDLGLVHLRTAKRLNRRRIFQQTNSGSLDSRISRQNEFFEQCILYWDMLGGFVNDDVDDFGIQNSTPHPITITASNHRVESSGQIFPHPWTGVAPSVQKMVAQTGRLIRMYRKHIAQEAASLSCLSTALDFDQNFLSHEFSAAADAISQAQMLEQELLDSTLPRVEMLVDAGDENTPVQHYIHLAEAYQYTGLLELYKVFPSVLLQRLSSTRELTLSNPSTSSNNNPRIPHVLFEIMSQPNNDSPDDFLLSLSLHIIGLLEKLPANSGTRCLQPLILMSAACELHFPSPSESLPTDQFLLPFTDSPTDFTTAPATSQAIPDMCAAFTSIVDPSIGSNLNLPSTFDSITSKELDIASARKFVVTRLQDFQLSLPAKPIMKAEMIIKETWTQWDSGNLGVYWMDVMDARGWSSIFG